MPQQAAAGAARGQRHPPEVAAGHPGHAVVPGQPLVQERVVGGDQVEGAAVLAQDALEEQLRLAAEGPAQGLVEVGEDDEVGRDRGQVAQVQPLGREVGDQRRRPPVGEHAPHLGLEHRGVAQLAAGRGLDQLVVGQAAPEEERQPRRQLEVAHPVRPVRPRGVALDPQQELGAHQQPAQGHLDALVEAAVGPALVEEAEQQVDVVAGGGPPVGAAGQGRQDLGRARPLGRRPGVVGRPAREDAAAARGVAGARRLERPRHRDGVHVRLRALVAADGDVHLQERLPVALHQLAAPADERRAHGVGTRGDRHPHEEVGVGRPVGGLVEDALGRGLPPRRRRHRHHLDRGPVEENRDVVRLAQAADAVGVPALAQLDPQLVLGVDREVVVELRPAPGAERHPVDMAGLVQVGRHDERVGDRRPHRGADREPGDPARRREVALEPAGVEPAEAHVVEAGARVVGGQQRGHVDVEVEQVADGVAVLGAVEAPQRGAPPGVGVGGGGPVELGLEVRDEPARRLAVRPRPARRRHHARPQLADDLLPDIRVVPHALEIEVVEGQPRRAQGVVVAGHAVAVEQRALRPRRRLAGGGPSRQQHGGDRCGQYSHAHPPRAAADCGNRGSLPLSEPRRRFPRCGHAVWSAGWRRWHAGERRLPHHAAADGPPVNAGWTWPTGRLPHPGEVLGDGLGNQPATAPERRARRRPRQPAGSRAAGPRRPRRSGCARSVRTRCTDASICLRMRCSDASIAVCRSSLVARVGKICSIRSSRRSTLSTRCSNCPVRIVPLRSTTARRIAEPSRARSHRSTDREQGPCRRTLPVRIAVRQPAADPRQPDRVVPARRAALSSRACDADRRGDVHSALARSGAGCRPP